MKGYLPLFLLAFSSELEISSEDENNAQPDGEAQHRNHVRDGLLIDLRYLQTKNETGPACGEFCEEEETPTQARTKRLLKLLPVAAGLILFCCCFCGCLYHFKKRQALRDSAHLQSPSQTTLSSKDLFRITEGCESLTESQTTAFKKDSCTPAPAGDQKQQSGTASMQRQQSEWWDNRNSVVSESGLDADALSSKPTTTELIVSEFDIDKCAAVSEGGIKESVVVVDPLPQVASERGSADPTAPASSSQESVNHFPFAGVFD